ncbi:hypothetical protein MMC09_003916 [Bachmanniomyces sp. S44760]|nr:hypothetical protein [Bachmanniomyces sp. S44760]
MSSNQVGFQFQGDVASGSALIYSATGRLLKSLSDGGVDFYAIAATVQLGRTIPITASQELVVSRLLASRTGRNGFVARALYLGWGHSDVAIELARTRAGTASLMLISALASGVTAFTAAESLQELLRLNGCDPDMLPNVDVLLAMIRYLAPFMHGFGFNSVLQTITCACEKGIRTGSTAAKDVQALLATGEPAEWTKAIKQLAYTAERREKVFLIVQQRAGWLAAFAVHILNMAVEVKAGAQTLWASAGTHGSAVLQLSPDSMEMTPAISLLHVDIPDTPSGLSPLALAFPMGKALDIMLKGNTLIMDGMADSIKILITKVAHILVSRVRFPWELTELGEDELAYGRRDRLNIVLRDLGLHMGMSKIKNRNTASDGKKISDDIFSNMGILVNALRCHQPVAESIQPPKDCLCRVVQDMIIGFSTTAVALIPCDYNSKILLLNGKVLNGVTQTSWTKATKEVMHNRLSLAKFIAGVGPHAGYASILIGRDSDHFEHLGFLFAGDDAPHIKDIPSLFNHDNGLVAVSTGHVTIYYKALLDAECVTNQGQIIKIAVGRLSMNKVLRTTVRESWLPAGWATFKAPPINVFKVAPSLQVVPHYAEGSLHAFLDASLAEDTIRVSCYIAASELAQSSRAHIRLDWGFKAIPRSIERCDHDPKSPTKALPFPAIATFGRYLDSAHRDCLTICLALSGNGLEQMVQAHLMSSYLTFWQLGACLDCTFTASQRRDKPPGSRFFEAEQYLQERDPRQICIIMTG